MLRPIYMTPRDAVEYGVIDHILDQGDDAINDVKSNAQWDRDAGLQASR